MTEFEKCLQTINNCKAMGMTGKIGINADDFETLRSIAHLYNYDVQTVYNATSKTITIIIDLGEEIQ